MRNEKEIREGLEKIEKIYLKEFGIKSHKDKPLNVDLTAMGVFKSIERIVRATEICTIKWMLDIGGGLNVEDWQYSKVKRTIKEVTSKPLTQAEQKARSHNYRKKKAKKSITKK